MGVVYDGVPSKHVPGFLGEGIEGRDAADGSTTNDLCDFMVPIWCVYSWPLSWTLNFKLDFILAPSCKSGNTPIVKEKERSGTSSYASKENPNQESEDPTV